jgi:uncharacterized protein YaiL (DUF2058 family)
LGILDSLKSKDEKAAANILATIAEAKIEKNTVDKGITSTNLHQLLVRSNSMKTIQRMSSEGNISIESQNGNLNENKNENMNMKRLNSEKSLKVLSQNQYPAAGTSVQSGENSKIGEYTNIPLSSKYISGAGTIYISCW